MASKKQTDEELLAQFDDLGEETKPEVPPSSKGAASKGKSPEDENDPLAELENLAQERSKSRPHTPKVGGNTTNQSSPKKSTDDKAPRKSHESGRSIRQAMTPGEDTPATEASEKGAEAEAAAQNSGGGGGWFGGWGGIMATAQSAVKQAEAIAKEIQKNEEAQRWAEQVKGNVSTLRTYGKLPIHLLHSILPRPRLILS